MSESWMPIARRPLRQELDRLWLNQQAAANNLANIQTPGFVGTRFVRTETSPSFDLLLSQELSRSDPKHLPALENGLTQDGYVEETVNDLSPDSEMAEVSKTSVGYQTLVELVARQDRMLRTAIEGR